MNDISILIPTYNDACFQLVADLQRQAASLSVGYEIIVADDGSTDGRVLSVNRRINQLAGCRFIERGFNSGRAAIRNFLALQAQHSYLLFIDSDMVVCRADFLQHYASSNASVVYGGVTIQKPLPGNLRSIYEKAAEGAHSVDRRQASPYQDFHTANFLIRRELMLEHPFDERFRHYGYEDVLFGRKLKENGIAIQHIDNPLSFEVYEPNDVFVSKTEEGLRTLYQFRHELQGYSPLLQLANRLPHAPIRWWHRLFGRWERRNLVGPAPRLLLFHLYKLGYFVSLY